ncbi:MAG: Type I-E CRISPR-associated protein Cas7/Cse4/CasC [Oscillospiraceae bacterium]|jgi:CRISPR system Cascade subunit CasC
MMLIEVHMLKNFAPTNLNRDDTGSPKSCMFGGVQRGRISSQCLKRSWRTSPLLKAELGDVMGIRTRKLPELVVDKLKANGIDEKYLSIVEKRLSGFANKDNKENKKGNWTSQVVIYSPEDIDAVAQAVQEKIESSKSVQAFEKLTAKDLENAVKGAKMRPISLDIALFGRMVTSNAFADVEASMQVAHAISTHRVVMETDFFTAMDDLIDGTQEMGAGMTGDIDYNSSCYYIYASLDTNKLAENLKYSENAAELVRKSVPALLRTMAFTNPSGKQNTFAGHSLPSAVLVECKKYPVPVSYANAFVNPAYASKESDLISVSIQKLVDFVEQTDHDFALPVKKRLWFCSGLKKKMTIAQNCENFQELVDGVSTCIAE